MAHDLPPPWSLRNKGSDAMNDALTAILLGIVEGVTEFLPVSSTGHLILASELLGYRAERWEVFNIVIQSGAILAVVVLYWRTLTSVLMRLLKLDPGAIAFVRNILLAFLPAAIIGLALHDKIEALLGKPALVAVALIVGGVAILMIERMAKVARVDAVERMPMKTALGVGFIQCISMIPGVSRSGATIMGALAMGVDRKTAAEFSFFLAIPTMAGATLLQGLKHKDEILGSGMSEIAIGWVVSFVVALGVIKAFVGMVSRPLLGIGSLRALPHWLGLGCANTVHLKKMHVNGS
jgi:undecaprenyl-diphosphatase